MQEACLLTLALVGVLLYVVPWWNELRRDSRRCGDAECGESAGREALAAGGMRFGVTSGDMAKLRAVAGRQPISFADVDGGAAARGSRDALNNRTAGPSPLRPPAVCLLRTRQNR